jgi:hypothetical protein
VHPAGLEPAHPVPDNWLGWTLRETAKPLVRAFPCLSMVWKNRVPLVVAKLASLGPATRRQIRHPQRSAPMKRRTNAGRDLLRNGSYGL